jgi:transposase-like protein
MALLKSPRTIELTEEQRAELVHLTRSPSVPAGKARRARMVLLAANGVPLREISRIVGVDRNVVRDWLDRYRRKGVAGLEDMPRPGRRPVFSPLGCDGVGPAGLSASRRTPSLAQPLDV